jgi:hypothetical protein
VQASPVIHVSTTPQCSNFHSSFQYKDCSEKVIEYFQSRSQHLKKTMVTLSIKGSVKPVYNGHPWDLKKWPFERDA